MIRRTVDGPIKVASIHHAHQPEIEILTATQSKGIWDLEDRFWWTNGDVEWHRFGYYHERYRREDGRWLIAARTVMRARVVTTGYFDYYAKTEL